MFIHRFSEATVCPYCGGDTKVVDNRYQIRLDRTIRTRQCKSCEIRYTTAEVIVEEVHEMDKLDEDLKRLKAIYEDIDIILDTFKARRSSGRLVPVHESKE